MARFHLATTLSEGIAKYGDRTALRYRQGGLWQEISWRAFGQQIRAAARGLLALGVQEGERVGIFSANCPQWTIADYAILFLRGVCVPLYATSSARQAEYILDEAQIGIVFVGSREQLNQLRAVHGGSPRLRRIIVFDEAVDLKGVSNAVYFRDFLEEGRNAGGDDEMDRRLEAASPDDLATLIYTSGTTGEPKGVMLHHATFQHCFDAHEKRLEVSDKDISMCFLPLSHIFERAWTHFALNQGMVVNYCDDTAKIVEYLQEVRPTIMCAVPRFYEKIYATIFERLEGAPPVKRRLFHWAIGIGWRVFLLKNDRQPIPPFLKLGHKIAEALVLKKLQGIVGGRIRFFPCAGAPLSQKIEEFFHAAGITIAYGYGLTETCATVTCHEKFHLRPGTVGKPVPGVEVKIADNGEILVKGGTVTKGYYRKPEATAEAFTADGWFRTGDAGVIEDGYLTITDRIKDLMKTSGGKYIAPQLIETLIGNDYYVEQVSVIGDLRQYVTALVVPSFPALEEYARRGNIPFASREDLVRHPAIIQFYEERIRENTRDLARYEMVQKFLLLPRPFTQEAEEITPTMKLKRKVINQHYGELIETMYR
jgi:long-chain acyl-CoA synthetase